jgi:tripartite-type tricarboxylate transporter receptor subunit TctC
MRQPFAETRRHALARCIRGCLTVTLFSWSAAYAEGTRSLRIVVPFPPGGTADILPRIVGDKLSSQFPDGVLIDNRPGAGGNIGAMVAYRSAPDGYTLFASPPGPIAINQNLYPNPGYDASRWVPITLLATVPNILAVSPSLPVRTLPEFIAYVRANPGTVSFASQGNGSTPHLTAALFMLSTGSTMLHVPYKGSAPAQTDLIGGQVDCFFDNLSASLALHKAGKIRIIAVADDHRSPMLPDIPTFQEFGLKDMAAVTWFTIVAPPGTTASLVNRLQKAIVSVLSLPEVHRDFMAKGAEVKGWSSEATSEFIKAETLKWQQVIKSAHVSID